MAIESLPSLPFVVEPLSPQRIQLWTSFASQFPTRGGFNVVTSACAGFWFESYTIDEYREYVREMLSEKVHPYSLVSWLDSLLFSFLRVQKYWSDVVGWLQQGFPEAAVSRWYQDASGRVSFTVQAIQQIVSCIVLLCEQYGLDLPQETQTYIAQQQAEANNA